MFTFTLILPVNTSSKSLFPSWPLNCDHQPPNSCTKFFHPYTRLSDSIFLPQHNFSSASFFHMASRPQLFSILVSRPQQPLDAHLLRILPSEMIAEIARALCRSDQYILMQVSVAFRICLEERFNRRTLTKTSDEQQLEYLLTRAQTLPGHWACEDCIDMHRADLHDFPLQARGCPLGFGPVQNTLSAPSAYIAATYQLKHHHIQLALK